MQAEGKTKTPVKLMINVSESYFTQVKKGAPVDVKLDVYGDEIFKGTINLIYPTIDAATRTSASTVAVYS